jgi:hypothetical protein
MALDPLDGFPVERLADNRLQGLLRELSEAIRDEEDPAILRALGQSLKMLADRSRSRGWELQPKTGNRHW